MRISPLVAVYAPATPSSACFFPRRFPPSGHGSRRVDRQIHPFECIKFAEGFGKLRISRTGVLFMVDSCEVGDTALHHRKVNAKCQKPFIFVICDFSSRSVIWRTPDVTFLPAARAIAAFEFAGGGGDVDGQRVAVMGFRHASQMQELVQQQRWMI